MIGSQLPKAALLYSRVPGPNILNFIIHRSRKSHALLRRDGFSLIAAHEKQSDYNGSENLHFGSIAQ